MDYEENISELKWKITQKIAFILMIISITMGLAITKNKFIKKVIPKTRELVQYSKENPQPGFSEIRRDHRHGQTT